MVLGAGGEYDGIIFVDADSVFHKPIDASWVEENLYRKDCMMTYLGRIGSYSECGFLYFNLRHPKMREWSQRLQDVYSSDEIFSLKEWHDSYVVDVIRDEFERQHGVKNHNIGFTHKTQARKQQKYNGHVQAWSILGEIYDHCKGSRKTTFYSPENKHTKQ